MKLNKTKQKWPAIALILSMWLLTLIISGCAEQPSAEDQCLQDLDNKNFSAVADNPDCSAYLRASGHMGLAGFLFENFLVKNASDNFRRSLDIQDWETKWENTPRQYHYGEARRLSGDGTGDYHPKNSRSQADAEIHLFASLGSIISESYIKFDITPDGKITKEEVSDFVNILPIDTSDDTNDGLKVDVTVDTMIFEKSGGGIFLIEIKNATFDARCEKCDKPDSTCDYSGIFKDATRDFGTCGLISQDEINDATAGNRTVRITGSCSAVVKVNELKFFKNNNVGEVAAKVVNLAGNLFTLIGEVSSDLNTLDISKDSELRKNLDEFNNNFVKKLDNGGTCDTNAVKSLNWGKAILDLVSKAPKVSYYDSSIDFKDISSDIKKGDVPLHWETKFKAWSGSEFHELTFKFGCDESSDLNSLKARLLFQSNEVVRYLPYYGECGASDKYCCNDAGENCGAKTAIKNSLTTLENITKDMTNDSTADDEKISFKEMICFDPTSDIL